MASTFTTNIQLEEPARGDQVGVWDTPVNNNMTLVDLVVGGIATIPLNNSPVVLAAAQFQARQITFNSTLTGSVAITFPSTFTKAYDIQNLCSGSSAFVITLGTTVAGGQVIAVPFGEAVECFNDGTNIKFKNLGRVGSYMDWAGSSVPAWISGCTVPPYLDCNGGTFSATTYPQLAVILGSTTLPDARGRAPYYMNEGTARLTTAGAAIDGNTRGAAGGANGLTLNANYIPTINSANAAQSITVDVPGSGANRLQYSLNGDLSVYSAGGSGSFVSIYSPGNNWAFVNTLSRTQSISVAFTNTNPFTIPATGPGFVSGLRLIRAG